LKAVGYPIKIFGCLAVLVSASFVIYFSHFSHFSQQTCGLGETEIGAFVEIPTGSFRMHSYPMYPEEVSPRIVEVKGFFLQVHEVSNKEFAKFVAATGYRTSAEKTGMSALFEPKFVNQTQEPSEWWSLKPGTTWWSPDGPDSDLIGLDHHPVVHVSWEDAQAYARWAGGRLLTEEEWEYAASLGLIEPDRPDSGAFGTNREPLANIWDGSFPHENTLNDGFEGRSPVGCFSASKLGVYDMIGNVWEWTATPFGDKQYTIKGGSHLCSPTHCHRFRPSARQGMDSDLSTSHIGIRIARDHTTMNDEVMKGRRK
jgi:formylglycine-generating enzyme